MVLVASSLVQYVMHQMKSYMTVEKLDGHCEQVLKPRGLLIMHISFLPRKVKHCWKQMAFAQLKYVLIFVLHYLLMCYSRMPLWRCGSQTHTRLYPGMECMHMTMGLEESICGQLFKSTSSNMGGMDQQKLISSTWWSGSAGYCLIWCNTELRVFQLGASFVISRK